MNRRLGLLGLLLMPAAPGRCLPTAAVLCLPTAAVLTRSADARPPSFHGLGFLPNGNHSTARGVSADGTVVVGASTGGAVPLRSACRWSDGVMTELGALPAHDNAYALAVSADGTVVVGTSGATLSGDYRAFRWTRAAGLQPLGDLPGGDDYSDGFAASADGRRIVGWSASARGALEAYYWVEGAGMTAMGFAVTGSVSGANGISDDGAVVTGASYDQQQLSHAFRWTPTEGFTLLSALREDSTETQGAAVSGDGLTIVGVDWRAGLGGQAVRWHADGRRDGLGVPPGYITTRATDVSFDGGVVVGNASAGMLFAPFVWDDANGLRLLHDVLSAAGLADALSGWTLTECAGISADGRTFVGTGVDPQGRTQAWRASLGCPADGDGDGDVDQQDLGLVLADYGCVQTPDHDCPGDLDADGRTTQADLGLVLASYGSHCR